MSAVDLLHGLTIIFGNDFTISVHNAETVLSIDISLLGGESIPLHRFTIILGNTLREYRLKHSKPIVDGIFEWLVEQKQAKALLPSDPFKKALNYLDERAVALRVFLEDPEVPLDTNHLERGLRPIPMGRRSWLFCWTELGAEQVGIIQSLISTCKLHDINPYVYLTDVLQRIAIHPNSQIEQLTPRSWKEHFANDPMGSDLELNVQNGLE